MSGYIILLRGDSYYNGVISSSDDAVRYCLRTLAEIKRVRKTITERSIRARPLRTYKGFTESTSREQGQDSRGTLDLSYPYSNYAGQHSDNPREYEHPEINGGYSRTRTTITGDDPETITQEIISVTPEIKTQATNLRKMLEDLRAEKLKYIIEERARRGDV